jgi:cytochrome c oxidase subunit 4
MSEHVVSKNFYYFIFSALMALTFLTVAIARIDLHERLLGIPLNDVVALTIAVAKALLVVLYFMHVRYSSRLTWVFVGAGFFWLGIMIALTLSDYMSRGWLSEQP